MCVIKNIHKFLLCIIKKEGEEIKSVNYKNKTKGASKCLTKRIYSHTYLIIYIYN